LAASSYVPDSYNDPYSFYDFNQRATLNVCEVARRHNAKIIYLSSYFYGPPQYVPVNEKHSNHPHNPYSQTKLISELIIEGYCRDFDLSACSLRLFNVYGPTQSGDFLLPLIISQIKNGEVTLKDPRPKRDFIHVNDVVDSIVCAIPIKGYHTINIGSGISHSVKEIIDILQSATDFKIVYTHEYRKGEVLDSVADITHARNILNWEPKINLKDGLISLLR
jgi:UDP-glucose 4-epimerase